MKRMIIRIGLPLVAAFVVAACGGGGGGGGYFPPIGGMTPPADPDTLDAFLAYVKSLVATALDTAEPADVTAFDPPTTTDTREPIATQ
ncbi:hypothetical protein QTI24_11830 [Variovorax sp. J22P240]|uniref:hypothetical protein n=1 Tax=unclassified Variovorax TaxID=663243 RepID=UPI002577629D|nr:MULTISPECIES: hypothetical protein [unclassified Variovorax]MDL9999297.1 hypothetical protein [Variovorax sp. J22P240]MDM0052586.1 hypothetical protein [Variovorax sp. J22R115]